jgi:hypothetical protein
VCLPFLATVEVTRSCHFISLISDEPVTPRNEYLIKDRHTPSYIATLDFNQPNRRVIHYLLHISEKMRHTYTISSRYKLWYGAGLTYLAKELLV